jgi:hypothetical protein
MKGTIHQRAPDVFLIAIDHGRDAKGKRIRKWSTFKGTKRQAQDECARLISAKIGGTYLEPSKTTLAQFFERWLEHMRSQVSPKSHARYSELARKNIVPFLGLVMLTKLRPVAISDAYRKALTEGRRDGAGGLSPQTVTHMHGVLEAGSWPGREVGIARAQPCRRD